MYFYYGAFHLSCLQLELQVVINIKVHESQKRGMKGGSETIMDRMNWIRNLGQEICNIHSI